ncbi:hypothetical protein E3N88_44729 [Mikania micrantha]|uniref:Uncharacterized protein n=1 Tax=Mikania micrantha TaxID=192012 RepID=A0A5N6LBH5_9ASTR|nr:hypothetical protein E3N88_44729 [Mikania micrantha]
MKFSLDLIQNNNLAKIVILNPKFDYFKVNPKHPYSELGQFFGLIKENCINIEACIAFDKEELKDFYLKNEANNRNLSVKNFISEELKIAAEKSKMVISTMGEKLLLNEEVEGKHMGKFQISLSCHEYFFFSVEDEESTLIVVSSNKCLDNIKKNTVPPMPKKLSKIMELPVNVTTNSHGAFYRLHAYRSPYNIKTLVT